LAYRLVLTWVLDGLENGVPGMKFCDSTLSWMDCKTLDTKHAGSIVNTVHFSSSTPIVDKVTGVNHVEVSVLVAVIKLFSFSLVGR
jgi:hypothetical protein